MGHMRKHALRAQQHVMADAINAHTTHRCSLRRLSSCHFAIRCRRPGLSMCRTAWGTQRDDLRLRALLTAGCRSSKALFRVLPVTPELA